MAYTTNPKLPKLLMEAVRLVKHKGWSTRQVARYTGYSQSVIVKWCKKDPTGGWRRIPTLSSRPHSHPKQLKQDIVEKIISQRKKHGRCSEVVHQELINQGIRVSLNSVRRTLDRHGLINKRSPWKRYHPHVDRPFVENTGDLVQLDTIHLMINDKKRIYVMTLIDVYSRLGYALAYPVLNGAISVDFLSKAERDFKFKFEMIQSDHGPEFSSYFVARIKTDHRYSRIGKPNDNSHIERFNRTLQEECLDKLPRDVNQINKALQKYLKYYNQERLHMGINLLTPSQMIPSYW
jgi:transposase InsO family protein